MNTEVMKAMNKQETLTQKIGKWWEENGYKINRVVLFPIWFGCKAVDKYNAHANAQQTWNTERATEILNYYIPRVADWNEEKKHFYFFDNGLGWSIHTDKIKFKDRRYWKNNRGKIRTYLIDTFELGGFTKEIGDCDAGWTELTFKFNNKRG